jgi:hypothetical protein
LLQQPFGQSVRLPGLQLLDARKHPLPTRTLWGPTWFDRDQVKRLIVLSPGETASADISFGVVGTPSNSVLTYYMAVTPPNCCPPLYLVAACRLPRP